MCWERLIKSERPATHRGRHSAATSMVAAPPAASQRHPAQEPPPARRADAEMKTVQQAEGVTAEPLIGIPARFDFAHRPERVHATLGTRVEG